MNGRIVARGKARQGDINKRRELYRKNGGLRELEHHDKRGLFISRA